MTKSFKAVLRDKHVKAILVNVFAGINRCDWVAKGVVDAMNELEIKIPIVVRLAGTRVEEGRRIIDASGLTMISANSLAEAAQKVVAAAKNSRAVGHVAFRRGGSLRTPRRPRRARQEMRRRRPARQPKDHNPRKPLSTCSSVDQDRGRRSKQRAR